MAIEERISAAEANRSFSRLLRGVREGKRYVITSHGTPVARIGPPEEDEDTRRAEAHRALLESLERQPRVRVEPWTREELYEDE